MDCLYVVTFEINKEESSSKDRSVGVCQWKDNIAQSWIDFVFILSKIQLLAYSIDS